MNQLEERRYYEEDDEIDLMELLHTILKHKFTIVLVTLIVTVLATVGGYLYNRSKTINSAIIGFNYPELQKGKNPDGSIFLRTNIIPLDVLNQTYEQYKDSIKQENLDDFRESIKIEPIIPTATQTMIDNALKRGENISFTASNYKIVSEDRDKELLVKIVNESVAKYINKYKPTYSFQVVGNDIYGYDYSDSYSLLSERIKMMEMAISSYENKNYMSSKLGYSFDMIEERIKNFKNVELQDFYSYYTINGLSKNRDSKLMRIDSKIQELTLENQALEGKAKVLKEMLQDLKPTEKQLIIPNVGQEGIKIKDENDYYSKLVADYVVINNNIQDNKVRIKLLENSKLGIKAVSSEDNKILEAKLRVATEKLNKIIEDMNLLTKEYVDSTYADMIKVVSPVTTSTEGKPLVLFLAVGVVLGGMLGVFLAFTKEFAKNYRNKYSK